jgi:hypothetical protein
MGFAFFVMLVLVYALSFIQLFNISPWKRLTGFVAIAGFFVFVSYHTSLLSSVRIIYPIMLTIVFIAYQHQTSQIALNNS